MEKICRKPTTPVSNACLHALGEMIIVSFRPDVFVRGTGERNTNNALDAGKH